MRSISVPADRRAVDHCLAILIRAILTCFALGSGILLIVETSEAITFEPVQNLSGEAPGSSFSDTFQSMRGTQLVASGARVYATWQEGGPDPLIVFRRSEDGGANWEPPQTLANGVRPTVVADGFLVFVTWQDQNTGCCSFRRSIDGGQTFEAAQNFGFITASSNNFYRLTIVGSRVYLLVLQTPNSATQNVGFRRSTDGGATWDPPLDEPPRVLSSRPPMQIPGLALAVAGQRVYAAWPSELDGSRVVFFRRSMDGGATFEPEEILVSGSVNPVELAATGDHVYFAASRFVGVVCDLTTSEPIRLVCFDSKEIIFRSSNDGGATWTPSLADEPVNVSGTSGSSDLPFVAAGPNNVTYLFWAESPTNVNFDPFDVVFRRSDDGGMTWEPALDQPATSLRAHIPDFTPPHVVIKGERIALAWQDGVPGSVRVRFRHSPDGGLSWDPALNLSALDVSEDIGGRPQVALGDAHAYVAWEVGSGDIFFRRAVESDMPLLGWPFIEPTGWAITGFGTGDCKGVNGETEGDHCGDDWYAQDWNFGSGNDDLGKVLLSATTGKVIFSGSWDGYGKEAIIQLNPPFEDFALRYTHLEEVWVTEGDEVCLGSPVGVVGFTGLSGGGQNTSHLHAVLYQKINEISARRNKGKTGLFWLERGEPVESIRSGTPATKFAAPLAFNPTMTASGCSEAFVLAGRVTTSANQGVPNVTLRLSGPISMETTPFVKRTGRQVGGGNYAFRDLPNGTYTVTPERRGYIFDPPSRTVTIAGGHVSGVDFVAIPPTSR